MLTQTGRLRQGRMVMTVSAPAFLMSAQKIATGTSQMAGV
jgi:hypothetical protein